MGRGVISVTNEDILTAQEAARLLTMTDRTVLNWAKTGELAGFQIGGGKRKEWRFKRADVEAFLNRNKPEQEGPHQ
jgi:excisionase family DNA binding protein